jgi:pyruvate/2-oxoglutarate dehydrogenase complex dihydrolipoamide dehydrogenase (E3) component
VEVGNKVVVLGGTLVGCETAEFLADKGKEVTIIEVLPEIAAKVSPLASPLLLNRLNTKQVAMLSGVQREEITEQGVAITNSEGQSHVIEADTIVLAVGARPNRALLDVLKDRVPEVHLAGDCVEPRDIMAAIADGARAGRAV